MLQSNKNGPSLYIQMFVQQIVDVDRV